MDCAESITSGLTPGGCWFSYDKLGNARLGGFANCRVGFAFVLDCLKHYGPIRCCPGLGSVICGPRFTYEDVVDLFPIDLLSSNSA